MNRAEEFQRSGTREGFQVSWREFVVGEFSWCGAVLASGLENTVLRFVKGKAEDEG